MDKQILVIGSVNADMAMRLERLPRLGETVTDGVYFQAYGGKGANQAVGAARAGGPVAFLGCVGDDAHGRTIRANFLDDGIDVTGLRECPGIATGSALIMFDRQGDNYLAVAPGANHALTPEDIDASQDLIDRSAMIVMQMEITLPTIRRALERAAAQKIPVLFNFAPAHDRDFPVTSAMTGLVVNEVEAEALWGNPVASTEEATKAAESLIERGPQFVIVTLGARGAVVVSEGIEEFVPSFPVTPVDSTAAGDVFCGSLAVALVEGRALTQAVRFASAAAALSVTRAGAQPSAPRRAEIDAFLEANPE